MKEIPPNLVSSDWIDLTERLSLKHYAAITAPEMLWRYGLGPRPTDLEDWIATADDLERARPFQIVKEISPIPTVPSKASGKGSQTRPAPEEEDEEHTEALQRRPDLPASSRSTMSSSGTVALEAVPLHQVPFVPPSLGKFSLIFQVLILLQGSFM